MSHGLFVAACGLLSRCGAWAAECVGSVAAAHGLSSCGAPALEPTGSVVAVLELNCPLVCEI